MFGGIAYMHAGNMCCGVSDDLLMARVGPDAYEQALRENRGSAHFQGKMIDAPGASRARELLAKHHRLVAWQINTAGKTGPEG